MLLPAGTASASGLPAAQTRVGAIHPTVSTIVGVAEHIAAGQRRVRAPSQLRLVSGHCVAAEAEVPAFARAQYGAVRTGDRAAAIEKSPTCPYCGQSPSTSVDHITSLKQDWTSGGWADDAATRTARVNGSDNLIGACISCNSSKAARELGEGAGQWWPSGWPSGVWWPFG